MMTDGLLRHWVAWVCMAVLIVAGGTAYGTDWIHDPNDEGDWFDENNWSHGVPTSQDVIHDISSAKILISSGNAESGSLGLGNDVTLRQTGGTNRICEEHLVLGFGWGVPLATATYELSGGELIVQEEELLAGWDSVGHFIHTGGTNTTPILAVGAWRGSYSAFFYDNPLGIYDLSGSGELFANEIYVGSYDAFPSANPGLFSQSGGNSHARYINVSDESRCELTGGTLELDGGLTLRGELDFAGQSPVLDIHDGSILNFGQGTVLNAQQAALNLGPTSLCIVPEGFDPAAEFGQYVNQGKTHTAGSTLEIAAGETIRGWGDIDDHVDCAGSLLASEGGVLELNGGLSIAEGGTVKARVHINDETSGMTGGVCSASSLFIGHDANGRFVQSGGTCELSWLFVTPGSGFEGSYELQSGHLITERSRVYGTGTPYFVQTGGTHTCDWLWVTNGGQYRMSGGVLEATYASLSSWEITDPAAEVSIGRLLELHGTVGAVEGTTIRMFSTPGAEPEDVVGFQTSSTDPAAQAGLGNIRLIFEGGTGALNTLEAAGLIDGGFTENFALGALQVGGESGLAYVRLVDEIDNGFRLSGAAEALFVDELLIGADSQLATGGLRLYVAHDVRALLDTYITDGRLVDGRQPAQPILTVYDPANDWTVVVPEPATLSLLALGGLAGIRRRRRP